MKNIFQTKKSAALIIALLIISAVAIFAFTAARSITGSIGRTSRTSEAMIAEEAAKGGIEWGLLTLKGCSPSAPYPSSKTCYVYNGSANSVCTLNFPTDATPSSCTTTIPDINKRYADIRGYVTVNVDLIGSVTGKTGEVYSIGKFGGVHKGLKATITISQTTIDYINY